MGRLYQIYGLASCLCVLFYCYGFCSKDRWRKALPLVFLVSFVFIVIHAKSISAPVITYILVGGLGIPFLIYGMLFRKEVLLIIAALYIPHNAILPADFGGIQKALNGTNIVLGAMFVAMTFGGKSGEARHSSKSKANVLTLIFLLTTLVAFIRGSLFFGEDYYKYMIFDFKIYVTPLLLYFMFVRMTNDRPLMRSLVSVLMIVVVMAFYLGVLEWVELGFGTYSGFKRRLGGLNMHPNNYGAFIAYYIGLIWGQVLVNFNRFGGKMLLLPVLMAVRIIIPTNSRGSWISLPPAVLVITLRRDIRLLAGMLVLLLLLVMLFPGIIPATVAERFTEAFQVQESGHIYYANDSLSVVALESQSLSISTRARILKTGLQLWGTNIFWGHGYGVFSYKLREYSGGSVRGTAHNGWLNMLVEMGAIAFFSLMSLFGYLLMTAWKTYRLERDPFLRGFLLGYLGCVPAILVANLTGERFSHVDLLAIFWMASALVVKLSIMNKEEMRSRGLGA